LQEEKDKITLELERILKNENLCYLIQEIFDIFSHKLTCSVEEFQNIVKYISESF